MTTPSNIARLPSPPFIDIPGLPNFRDIGGYPVSVPAPAEAPAPGGGSGKASRRIIRPGVLFRAAEPSRTTEEGVARLRELGITTVYDLRSAREIGSQDIGVRSGGATVWDGASRQFAPVFLDEDYSPAAIAERFADYGAEGTEGFVRAYAHILRVAADPSNPYRPFPAILEQLAAVPAPSAGVDVDRASAGAEEKGFPILVHCTAGKDRTGVICALVLSLCGVADEVVAHEYSLTDIGLAERKQEFIDYLVKSPALKGDKPSAERMISARKENMLATLAMIRDTYGSAERYVTAHCGLTPAQVEQIRRNLVVEVEAEAEAAGTVVVDWEAHARILEGSSA